jgi:GAF domain-containing protein
MSGESWSHDVQLDRGRNTVKDADPSTLGAILATLAVELLKQSSLKADLERLARLTTNLVPACSGASISMVVDGEPSTVAATDRVSLELDLAQYEADNGPCVVALGGEKIRIAYLPGNERFPHFATGAADRRVLSVLSTPAFDHGVVVASLNMYSRQADAFDEIAENVALIVAAEIGNAVVKSALMRTARTTREELQEEHDEAMLVSTAKGVLMAMQDCSAAQADVLLRQAATVNGEHIMTTAERILATTRAEPAAEVIEAEGP